MVINPACTASASITMWLRCLGWPNDTKLEGNGDEYEAGEGKRSLLIAPGRCFLQVLVNGTSTPKLDFKGNLHEQQIHCRQAARGSESVSRRCSCLPVRSPEPAFPVAKAAQWILSPTWAASALVLCSLCGSKQNKGVCPHGKGRCDGSSDRPTQAGCNLPGTGNNGSGDRVIRWLQHGPAT